MKIKYLKKISFSIFLVGIFLLSSINDSNITFDTKTPTFKDKILEDNENTSLSDLNDINSEIKLNDPLTSAEINVKSWWNNTYRFRKRIEITNSLDYNVTQPIDLFLDFSGLSIYRNSIRVVKYDSTYQSWKPIPYQFHDDTTSGGGNILETTNITLIGENIAPGINPIYIYYDIESETHDPTDYSKYTFQANFDEGTGLNDNLSISWTDPFGESYELSLNGSAGSENLISNGYNFHTENSTAPGRPSEEYLVGYWPFDDNLYEKTETYLDQGQTPDEFYQTYGDAGTSFQEGYFGSALDLDGVGDFIQVDANEYEYGGKGSPDGFTVMAWIKPNTLSGERIIASWDRSEFWRFAIDDNDNDGIAEVAWHTADNVGGGINDMWGESSQISTSDWVHVSAVFNPSATNEKKIYVNGQLILEASAHDGASVLGDNENLNRYGYIGTGSEADYFGDNVPTPQNEFSGLLDELRIYNSSLDTDEINKAMQKTGEQSTILNIEEVENGPVFAKYNINWENITYAEGDMNITDTWTFYRGLNQWKIERTYYWNFSNADLDSMALFNSLYNWDPSDANPDTKDYYFYDDTLIAGHNDLGFSISNYTVLYDYDNDNHGGSAIGLFLTDVQHIDHLGFIYNSLNWKASANTNDKIVNFLVGDQIDMDNWQLSGNSPQYYGLDWCDLNLTIEYWEFLQYDYGKSTGAAASEFDNLYSALQTDLLINKTFSEEEVFYNLVVEVKDIDGLLLQNVNVTLNTFTTNPYVTTPYRSQLTDSEGTVTFADVDEGDYTLNFTFSPFGKEIWLKIYNITLDPTTVSGSENYLYNSTTVGVTSMELQFLSSSDGITPCTGAIIGFTEFNENTKTFEFLGNKTADGNGNITIWYKNYTSIIVMNITSKLYLGDSNIDISFNELTNFKDNLSVSLDKKNYKIVYIQTEAFQSSLNITSLTENYIYQNDTLKYELKYFYNDGSIIHNISQANVAIQILYGDTPLYSNLTYGTTDGTGNLTVNLNYSTFGLLPPNAYSTEITVSKDGYETKTKSISFTLKDIPTSLELETINAQIMNQTLWNENLTLTVKYFDYEENPISNALIEFEIDIIQESSGTMEEKENKPGWYSIDLNSTDFISVDQYSVSFTASKSTYQRAEKSHTVSINPRPTSLTPESPSITCFWNNIFTLTVQFNETELDLGINDAMNVYWNQSTNSLVSGILVRNESAGDGYYSASINTSIFTLASSYTINVFASRENYLSDSVPIALKINAIPTLMQYSDGTPASDLLRISIEINETDSILFNFTYINSLTDSSIINASTAKFAWEYTTGDTKGTGDLVFIDELYQIDFNTESLDAGNYLLLITLSEPNYELRQAMIILTVKKRIINLEYADDFGTAQIIKEKGDQWDLTIILKDQSRNFEYLTGVNVSLTFSNVSYTVELLDQNNGYYTAILNWSELSDIFEDAGVYNAQLILGKDTFATQTIDISLILKDRQMDIQYLGDFGSQGDIIKVNGEEFTFSVELKDTTTNKPILGAEVFISFPNRSFSLELTDEDNDGIYTLKKIFTDEEVSAFFRDDIFVGTLNIIKDNYAISEDLHISITVKMNEISDGIPTFYVLIAIGGLLILVGTLGGYKLVQTARIPAFIKIIDKVIKNVKGDKTISDENITLSSEETMVEKLGDKWKLLDLNLAEILGISKESEIAGANLATGEEATGGV